MLSDACAVPSPPCRFWAACALRGRRTAPLMLLPASSLWRSSSCSGGNGEPACAEAESRDRSQLPAGKLAGMCIMCLQASSICLLGRQLCRLSSMPACAASTLPAWLLVCLLACPKGYYQQWLLWLDAAHRAAAGGAAVVGVGW